MPLRMCFGPPCVANNAAADGGRSRTRSDDTASARLRCSSPLPSQGSTHADEPRSFVLAGAQAENPPIAEWQWPSSRQRTRLACHLAARAHACTHAITRTHVCARPRPSARPRSFLRVRERPQRRRKMQTICLTIRSMVT